LRVATGDGRYLGLVERSLFTRRARSQSWRPSELRAWEPPKSSAQGKRARRRRQRYQRRTDRFARAGKRPLRVGSSESRSEERTVKRAPPRSRCIGRPRAFRCAASNVLGRATLGTRKTFAWTSTEPQGSGSESSRKAAALGTRRSTSARVERFRSAESRSDATFGRDACERPRPGGRHAETRDLARRIPEPPPTRRLRKRASEDAARASSGIF